MMKDENGNLDRSTIATEFVKRRRALITLTSAVIIIQLLSLILLPIIYPLDVIAWMILLFFFILTLLFGILVNVVNRKDVDQFGGLEIQLNASELPSQDMPIRDPTTNLFSRQYLEESLERELQRSLRDHLSIGLIKIRVDQFDRLTENFGPHSGDIVLRIVAEQLQESIRASDIACRFGDEEFVLMISEAPQSLTLERAEHLRANVEQIKINYEDQVIEGITISLGVAIYPVHGTSLAVLMKNAASALQHAQDQGCNQVVIYQKELAG